MKEYLATMEEVFLSGEVKADRTGTGTYSLFAPREMRFSFDDGFPVGTTKRVAWKSLVWELLWFLRGETNANWLKARGVTIWDEWAREDGDLGPVYGAQWRRWPGYDGKPIDQIARVICTTSAASPGAQPAKTEMRPASLYCSAEASIV